MPNRLIVVSLLVLCLVGPALAKQIPFGPQREISISEGPALDVTHADVDGDGDLDLITASGVNAPSGAYWYENLDGKGSFSAARVIDDCSAPAFTLCNAFLPEMVDMDGDGDLDALTGNPNLIAWYENLDGDGNFGLQIPIRFDTGASLNDVAAADIDGDGDADAVATASAGNKVAWYQNLGGGTFAGTGLSEILIGTGLVQAQAVAIGDLNRDGRPDVLVASNGDSSISWFANLGGGTFGSRQIISSTTSGANDVDVADVNRDGRPDVVSVAASNSADGAVRWYDNINGDGSSWIEATAFTGSGGFPLKVTVADLDGDGDSDLLTTWFGSTIGGLDRVAWYENGTAGATWTERVVSTRVLRPSAAAAADLDGDGDLDVASSSFGPVPAGTSPSDEKLAWYRNRTIHRSAAYPLRSSIDSGAGYHEVAAADLDRDGDVDVIGGDGILAVIEWFDNTDGAGDLQSPGLIGSISSTAGQLEGMLPVDLDADGDLDLVAAEQDVSWYENTGGGSFAGERLLAPGLDPDGGGPAPVGTFFSAVSADVDGNGDPDLVVGGGAVGGAGTVGWIPNDGTPIGEGAGSQSVGPNLLEVVRSVAATDVDGDGDVDVIAGAVGGGTSAVNWYANQQQGLTVGEQLIARPNSDTFIGQVFVTPDTPFGIAGRATRWRIYGVAGRVVTPLIFERLSGSETPVRTDDVYAVRGIGTSRTVVAGVQEYDFAPIAGSSDRVLPHYLYGWKFGTPDNATETLGAISSLFNASNELPTYMTWGVSGSGPSLTQDATIDNSSNNFREVGGRDYSIQFDAAGVGFAAPQTIASPGSIVAVATVDMDRDGDPDLLVATAGQLVWYANRLDEGTADFAPAVTIAGQTEFESAIVADLDRDGDADVAAQHNNEILWFENVDGLARSWTSHVVAPFTALGAPRAVATADIDRDGDLELVSAESGSGELAYYRNLGGQFRVTVQDAAAGEAYEGEESPLMAVTLALLGRSGDPVGRLATLSLNFRDSGPLSTAQATALISELRIYRDNGNGAFNAASDTLVVATPLSLNSGIMGVSLPANDANTRIAAPATFFVVAVMSPTASSASPNTFQVDYLLDTAVVDSLAGIPLQMEFPRNIPIPQVTALGRLLVESAIDEDDTNPGDGNCQGTSGFCTLRAAVEEANARAGDDLIVVPPALGPFVLNGALFITDTTGSLTIRSAGPERAVIDGGGVDRVFFVNTAAAANFERLTVTNGSVASNMAGGGIANVGTLTVTDCEIVSNTGGSGGGLAGVSNSSTLLSRSTISGNTALNSGGGLASITGSTVEVRDSLVADNVATNVAGAIWAVQNGVVTLVNSTVARNDNPLVGSAAIVGGSGAGAGSSIDSLTIAGNSNGGIGWYGPSLSVRNTLVADNGVDIVGPPAITSLGHNLIGDRGTNTAFVDGVNNDQVGGGPNPVLLARIAPLGDYGGSTLTRALEADSPAIDAGVCVTSNKDQRGVARPIDVPAIANVTDGCDVGSYEALLGRTEVRLEVPVRWCGVAGAPSIEDPSLLGAGSVNDLLRARHERAADKIYIPQGNVSFRSAANFIIESYPVLEDPDCTETSPGIFDCTYGERGDVYVNPEEANFFEFQQLIASCREAWQAQDPTISGITAVHINRFVDANGNPLELLGLGGRAEPGDIAEQSAAGRLMVVDNFYRRNVAGNPNPPNPEDVFERLFGHEMGHALSLRHGDGLDNDQDGILDNDDEKALNLPRFDGPNLMQYRAGTELTTEQMSQLRSHIVFAVPDVVVQPTVDSLASSSPIDDERARILEFGYGEVVDLERARILEFAEASPLDFERARILEFERARLLEFERARLLEFENARILEFGMTYTGETNVDSTVLIASTGSLPWPAPIRPTTSYYYYLDLDRSDATGGYPAASPNPSTPGLNFPGTDVVPAGGDITEEAGVDMIAEIVLESSCPDDVCTSTATLNAYDFNDSTGAYELVFNDPAPVITAKGVGLYIDNGGDPVDLDDAPIGMTLQPRIPNSLLFAAGWGFQTDPGSGAQIPNPVKMEVVTTIECDGLILNDDSNSSVVDCQCTDCNVCPDYPGCVGPVGTPVTLTGTRIPTEAKAGELMFMPPVLPQATVSPLLAEEGQTVSVFITDLPTDIADGNVEVTLNGVVLTPPIPTSSIAQDGSITVLVNLPLGLFGDLTLSAGITGFAPRANAVVNVTPALRCPDNDADGLCDAVDPDDDNDGVADEQDSSPFNSQLCSDTDNDTCDDCSSGTFDVAGDGPDFDLDGLCDAGDPDDDNDGVADALDPAPLDAMSCGLDADSDGCDDCAVGVDGSGPLADDDPANDGPDADADGICDTGDGCPADPAKVTPGICGCGVADTDTDNDGAADCVDPCPTDPLDLDMDGDGQCDVDDADDDNDGVDDTLDPAPLDPDVCGDSDVDTCDDCSVGTDDYGPLADADPANDGQDTDADGICDAGTSCPQGADIAILAQKHTVGSGNNPGSTKEPLVGIEICAYDSAAGSCAQDVCGGTSHNQYTCIASGDGVNGPCDTAMCCTTDANGECAIHVVPGQYVVISDEATKTVLPDPLGVSAGTLGCGDLRTKHLQQIVKANGKKVPGKTTRMTGSELLIIEPEYVIWEETQELYPFVFETVGDWGVTATVTPPEGFVADHEALTAEVDNELEAVQFVITEIGSDLVPTGTTFQITHGTRRMVVHSDVDLFLTPEYARSRGFSVQELRRRGLIREKEQIAREPRPDIDEAHKTRTQRAWESARPQDGPATPAAGGDVERPERGEAPERSE